MAAWLRPRPDCGEVPHRVPGLCGGTEFDENGATLTVPVRRWLLPSVSTAAAVSQSAATASTPDRWRNASSLLLYPQRFELDRLNRAPTLGCFGHGGNAARLFACSPVRLTDLPRLPGAYRMVGHFLQARRSLAKPRPIDIKLQSAGALPDRGLRSSSLGEHDRSAGEELSAAESLVERTRALYKLVYRAAKRDVAYRRMLATSERCDEFEARLLVQAGWTNARLDAPLPAPMVKIVVIKVARTIARFQHAPIYQRERQAKQAATRRRRNRSRDAQIVYLHSVGESLAAIGRKFPRPNGRPMSKSGVRKVLLREAERLEVQRRAVHAEHDTSAAG